MISIIMYYTLLRVQRANDNRKMAGKKKRESTIGSRTNTARDTGKRIVKNSKKLRKNAEECCEIDKICYNNNMI